MMAIVGTFAFNFTVVMPLFVKTTLGGDGHDVHPAVLGGQRRSLVGGAGHGPRKSSISIRDVDQRASACSVSAMLVLAVHAVAWRRRSRRRCFVGFASIVFMTASTAIVQLRAAPEMRGRVLALQAIVFLGSTPDRRPDPRARDAAVRGPCRVRGRRRRLLRGRRVGDGRGPPNRPRPAGFPVASQPASQPAPRVASSSASKRARSGSVARGGPGRRPRCEPFGRHWFRPCRC